MVRGIKTKTRRREGKKIAKSSIWPYQGALALGDLSRVAGLRHKILLLGAHKDSFSDADNAALYIGLPIT
jgi:hypothetical protein